LVLLRLDDEISAAAFVMALMAILLSQFLILMELCATMAFFGFVALGLAYLNWPGLRPRQWSAAWLAAIALGLTAVIASPLLYFAFIGSGMGLHQPWSPAGGDLLELLVPKNALLLGELPLFTSISANFKHWQHETGAYIGLPALLIVILRLRRPDASGRTNFLVLLLAIIYIAMLGTQLHFAGVALFPLPWWLFAKLPFLNSAMPSRFAIYVHLILAIIVASWMAQSGWPKTAKRIAAALLIASLLPNPHADVWAEGIETPEFFTSEQYRDFLKPGENVLVLPYTLSQAYTWQALSKFYYSMPQAWLGGPTPPSLLAWPIVYSFVTRLGIPQEREQLYAFLASHGVSAVIMDPRQTEVTRGVAFTGTSKCEPSRGRRHYHCAAGLRAARTI
jgi:hypothetical protein